MRAHSRSADRDDAYALIGAVAEAPTQIRATAECIGVLADDVARELEVLGHPVTHRRQALSERQGDNVFWRTYEDSAIAHCGMALDMPDHLGIVVRRQEGLVHAARWHGHIADEIGKPGELGPLQFRVL